MKPLLVVKRGREHPDWFPPAAAVYHARWSGENRVVIVFVLEGKPGIYIAPPIPSPACTTKLSKEELEVLKWVLKALGSSYVSSCRVILPAVYRDSLDETLRGLSALGILDCVGEECEEKPP